MKKEFSKKWKASKRPGKQRKYVANAPMHIKKKLLNANMSKDLRKKYGRRSTQIRKGDTVKVMRGQFFGKEGKILDTDFSKAQVEVEGIQRKKQDGSKVNIKLKASNLQITELNLDDSRRAKFLKNQKEEKKTKSKNDKEEIKNAP